MSGTANVLSGFIDLTVPPDSLKLNDITTKNYPLSISFAPRSTPPSLQGNKIVESTDNSTNDCTYRGNKYKLEDIQICSVMNKGFLLPGQNVPPVAELIITFSTQSNATGQAVDGILLCVPIYESNTPDHNEYLTQLIDPDMPKCNYTEKEGVAYTAGEYKNIPNSTLMKCVKECCGDPNCISYTFNSGKCSLNNVVSDLSTTSDKSITSGTINRGRDGENTVPHKSLSPTLDTIFYNSAVDTSQVSLAYMTTFNTVNSSEVINATKKLYIVVFPNGIRMTPSTYQQLFLQMRSMNPSITQALLPYYVPLEIRNYDYTLASFEINSSGNKVIKRTSNKGEISQTIIASCDSQFKNRVEYFIKPPYYLSKTIKSFNSEKCPYYKTTEYKCVPFNQLHDLSGVNQDAYVIPGNSTLQGIIDGNKSSSESSASISMATDDIIVYTTTAVCGIIAVIVLYKIGIEIQKNF